MSDDDDRVDAFDVTETMKVRAVQIGHYSARPTLYSRSFIKSWSAGDSPSWFSTEYGYGSDESYGKYVYWHTLNRAIKLLDVEDKNTQLCISVYCADAKIRRKLRSHSALVRQNMQAFANAQGGGDNHTAAELTKQYCEEYGYDGWIARDEDADGMGINEIMLCTPSDVIDSSHMYTNNFDSVTRWTVYPRKAIFNAITHTIKFYTNPEDVKRVYGDSVSAEDPARVPGEEVKELSEQGVRQANIAAKRWNVIPVPKWTVRQDIPNTLSLDREVIVTEDIFTQEYTPSEDNPTSVSELTLTPTKKPPVVAIDLVTPEEPLPGTHSTPSHKPTTIDSETPGPATPPPKPRELDTARVLSLRF